ncbi:50S ribosomal protein L9 [Kamptonema cortianum]|nr:50S ribosomal protein L9 [Geitlerinema splendidum]MDK3156120.1 50S ribosomal protein L9 [Kamptonema cortianum]
MKIILTQAVPKLGKEGQLVNVKPGYARNFLFPQGKAIVADRKQIQVLERRNAKIAAQLAATKADAEALAEKINGASIKIETKAGPDRRLFGAVTSQDISDAIKSQLSADVDKKDVLLLRPIKRLGKYDIELNVHRDVNIEIKLNVFDPEFVEEEAEMLPELVEALAEEEAVQPPVQVAEEASAEETTDETEEDSAE